VVNTPHCGCGIRGFKPRRPPLTGQDTDSEESGSCPFLWVQSQRLDQGNRVESAREGHRPDHFEMPTHKLDQTKPNLPAYAINTLARRFAERGGRRQVMNIIGYRISRSCTADRFGWPHRRRVERKLQNVQATPNGASEVRKTTDTFGVKRQPYSTRGSPVRLGNQGANTGGSTSGGSPVARSGGSVSNGGSKPAAGENASHQRGES
jgi:hypothetical protein